MRKEQACKGLRSVDFVFFFLLGRLFRYSAKN